MAIFNISHPYKTPKGRTNYYYNDMMLLSLTVIHTLFVLLKFHIKINSFTPYCTCARKTCVCVVLDSLLI